MEKSWLTVGETAEILSISPKTVYTLVLSGDLPPLSRARLHPFGYARKRLAGLKGTQYSF